MHAYGVRLAPRYESFLEYVPSCLLSRAVRNTQTSLRAKLRAPELAGLEVEDRSADFTRLFHAQIIVEWAMPDLFGFDERRDDGKGA